LQAFGRRPFGMRGCIIHRAGVRNPSQELSFQAGWAESFDVSFLDLGMDVWQRIPDPLERNLRL